MNECKHFYSALFLGTGGGGYQRKNIWFWKPDSNVQAFTTTYMYGKLFEKKVCNWTLK